MSAAGLYSAGTTHPEDPRDMALRRSGNQPRGNGANAMNDEEYVTEESPDSTQPRPEDKAPMIRCGYYVPGHEPHFIQVIRVAKPICDVRAVIGESHPEGGVWIRLTFPDGHVESWWDHDRDRVTKVLGAAQPCEWQTTGLLLVGERIVGVGMPAFCLSKTANVLAACTGVGETAGLEPGSGGFLIGPPNGKGWGDLTDDDVDALVGPRATQRPHRRAGRRGADDRIARLRR